ncbi:ParB/RepB/Spo0J family partition protein [Cellulosimicrobium marinum]|uniref:ParB/RepB/Spo0J family partition protein n=1 Tax=Cellulosimicrobium marinum TaxID=1638992 RepID=UPI001E546E94|nr:ParB/RepB/Spo0J family partition protein [Cellulosimicrobium marinum]MCB7135773.1 ParB/RepB/Spo0J family partition protein [Cellulosimicrobium marinum]
MSEKRRGLGRGLGALIPTSSEGKRPVDVFFPSAPEQSPSSGPSQDESGSAVESGGTVVATLEAPAGEVPAGEDTISPSDVSVGEFLSTSALEDGEGVDEAPVEGHRDAAVTDDVSPSATGGLARTDDGAVSGASNGDTPSSVVDAAPSSDDPVSRETSATTGTASADAGSSPDPSSGAVAPDDAGTDGWIERGGDDLVPVPGARFAEVPVEAIVPNPRQPRTVFDEGELDELVGSIKEIGVLQPVVVRPLSTGSEGFELIMGERRWRATQAAGLATIPAIIRETDDGDLLRDALLENLHRSALNPLEEAAAYRQLLDDFGCTHEELAERISRSRPQISNTLRLLRLPPLVQRRVAAGVLSAGHARALLGLTDGAEIERLAQRIVAEGLSVRATEEIVSMGGLDRPGRAPRTPRAGQRSAAVDELATRLSDRFETRVKVDLGKSKGRLTVEFASVEDLNRILDLMAPEDPGLLRN